ncbi:MAG: Ycf66 family protein [Phormidesmis sp.]
MLANTLLADALSVLLGLSSLSFYIAAFFYPEVHRRFDPLWSGLGLLYAAILWFCAGQMTAIILLSQLIVVILLIGLGWQTLSIRREKTPVYQQTPVVITPEVVGGWAKNKLNQLRIAPPEPVPLRLEKRTLSEFSSERLDPRRRPVYDYEFVEDGIADEVLRSPLSDPPSDSPPLALSENTELSHTTPPSAEAEVLSVESPDTAIYEPDDQEPDDQEPEALNEETVEPAIAAQPAAPQAESSKSDDLDTEVLEADEDWGDDIFVTEPLQPEPEPQKIRPAEEMPKKVSSAKPKPSLLSMPLILIGWLKDVVTSLTTPKPSKPIIEIPRREPSIKVDQKPVASIEKRSLEERPAENLEESNWDD